MYIYIQLIEVVNSKQLTIPEQRISPIDTKSAVPSQRKLKLKI